VQSLRCWRPPDFSAVDSLDESGRAKTATLDDLVALNRRVMKACLLKESLERLWTYPYEEAMLRYLYSWVDQLRWQRLAPFQKLARMLVDHLDGILNHCRTKVRFGVVEAINGNIKTLPEKVSRLQKSRPALAEGSAYGGTKTEFHRSSESSLKCVSLRILVQNPILKALPAEGEIPQTLA
jgi:hypothetical protein